MFLKLVVGTLHAEMQMQVLKCKQWIQVEYDLLLFSAEWQVKRNITNTTSLSDLGWDSRSDSTIPVN